MAKPTDTIPTPAQQPTTPDSPALLPRSVQLMLTPSEIEELREHGRALNAFAHAAFQKPRDE